jgi:hypothetical protein
MEAVNNSLGLQINSWEKTEMSITEAKEEISKYI